MQLNIISSELYSKHSDTILWASIMGCAFLPSFFLIGTSTRLAGITATTMANKLSMIIPAGFAVALGIAVFTPLHALAITLGILAVYIVSSRKVTDALTPSSHFMFPWLVFISGGMLDLGLMYLNKYVVTDESIGLFSIHVFLAAAVCGLIVMSILILTRHSFEWKAMLSGLLLGIPNYFSVYFLLKTLRNYHHDGSFVFPVLNLSVILIGTLASVFLFKEKISVRIITGLLIACSSIGLLYLTKI